MAQRPAVVFIARHGPRLDAADQSWHLSTPTPYDPPLTYAGWNQSRALGVRIAALLDARAKASDAQDDQQASEQSADVQGISSRDFAVGDGGSSKRKNTLASDDGNQRTKRRKHKVVIHTSPFLRCVQTSVAIAAGMAQFQPEGDLTVAVKPNAASRPRTPASLHSASPRLRAMDGTTSSSLAPIPEPKAELLNGAVRTALVPHPPRSRKSKLRVDAFLGEWLNPQYYDQITPPPPSAMMVATAKAELMSNEQVDSYTPTIPYASGRNTESSLWAGSRHTRNTSKDSIDTLSSLEDALPQCSVLLSPRRDRTSSFSNAGSSESHSARSFRSHFTQPVPAIVKPHTAAYQPPVPHYAVSGSDSIPRGYVAHARQACANVDTHWDSSRAPQSWGDGGEYGEEWSAMHKRFRRGVNHLVQWYSQHNADDRAEDALGLDQAEHHAPDDEDEEELVMILVTHGAGCNALIGSLTAQPVLLDIGMASLTMAVRKENAPPMTTSQARLEMINGQARRGSIDMGLSAVYDMKIVSSSEHLRPGVDPAQVPTSAPMAARRPSHVRDTKPKLRLAPEDPSDSASEGDWDYYNQPGRGSNSSLGSMLRPALVNMPLPASTESIPLGLEATVVLSPPVNPGLWTPPASRTPLLQAEKRDTESISSRLSEAGSANGQLPLGASPPHSQSPTSNGSTSGKDSGTNGDNTHGKSSMIQVSTSETSKDVVEKLRKSTEALARASNIPISIQTPPQSGSTRKSSIEEGEFNKVPNSLSRGLSQKGLWGSRPRGAKVERKFLAEPKRRWSVTQRE